MSNNEFMDEINKSDFVVYGKNNELNCFAIGNFKKSLEDDGDCLDLITELINYRWTTGNKTFDKLFKQDLREVISEVVIRYKLKSKI